MEAQPKTVDIKAVRAAMDAVPLETKNPLAQLLADHLKTTYLLKRLSEKSGHGVGRDKPSEHRPSEMYSNCQLTYFRGPLAQELAPEMGEKAANLMVERYVADLKKVLIEHLGPEKGF